MREYYTVLLKDLRQTKGFKKEEIEDGVLQEREARRALLDLLKINYADQASNKELVSLIYEYQRTHCLRQ